MRLSNFPSHRGLNSITYIKYVNCTYKYIDYNHAIIDGTALGHSNFMRADDFWVYFQSSFYFR